MAFNATAVGRVRINGNDANGAFFDAATSGALSTTLNGSISAGATTIVVASATGWPSSGNYYARIGNVGAETTAGSSELVLVTGGQGTTSWTVTRAQKGTTALAFASGVVVDNDASRCDTATGVGTAGTSTNSTTFIDATFAAFDLSHVGNCIRVSSGTGATVGYYFIQSITNATTVVLDRVSGTYTNGAWKVGGAAATPNRTINSANATGDKVVPGNTVYIQGLSDTPSATDYADITSFIVPVSGTLAAGRVAIIGERGRPRFRSNGLMWHTTVGLNIQNLYVSCSSNSNGSFGIINTQGNGFNNLLANLVVDTNNQASQVGVTLQDGNEIRDSELFAKTTAPSASSGADLIVGTSNNCKVIGCYIHHSRGKGISSSVEITVENTIVYACQGDSINISGVQGTVGAVIRNNIIDAGLGDAISLASTTVLGQFSIFNNQVTNHNQSSKTGLKIGSGTAALNDSVKNLCDYNNFYNNTANYSGISAGANDTADDPGYTSAGSNWNRSGTSGKATGFPHTIRNTSTIDYQDRGLQGLDAGGGMLVHPGMAGGMRG